MPLMFKGEKGFSVNPDYFLAHRPTQSKREVAEYVESQGGILVPQRFAGLDTALASGKPFIVRSEHPQDYDGASGVFESLLVSPDIIEAARKNLENEIWSDDEFRPGRDHNGVARLLVGIGQITQEDLEAKYAQATYSNALEYCSIMGISLESFMAQTTYSYWEAIPGVNRAVVADTSIKGRYHIFSDYEHAGMAPVKGEYWQNYIIVEDGKIVMGAPRDLPEDNLDAIQGLIGTYEGIRNLDRFSTSNCPIVEIQSNGTSQYFLQYLIGRDFKAPEFDLERDPEKDEISATLAIGTTPPEGLDVEVTYIELFSPNYELPTTEAVLNKFVHPMFVEPLVKSTRVQIIPTGGSDEIFAKSRGHTPRSILFKPEISVLFLMRDLEKIMSSKTGYPRVDYESGKNTFRVRIVSDGRRAYLKRTR